MLAAAQGIGWIFTTDPAVHAALATALLVLAVGQPAAGYVFVLDGVQIRRECPVSALAGLANLLVYLPLLAWVAVSRPAGNAARSGCGPLSGAGVHAGPRHHLGAAGEVGPLDRSPAPAGNRTGSGREGQPRPGTKLGR